MKFSLLLVSLTCWSGLEIAAIAPISIVGGRDRATLTADRQTVVQSCRRRRCGGTGRREILSVFADEWHGERL